MPLAQRKAAQETLEALQAGAFKRAVTGAGGIAKAVGPRLAAAGVTFLKVAGAVVGVASFVLAPTSAEADDFWEFHESLTDEEYRLWRRYNAGEDIFAEEDP